MVHCQKACCVLIFRIGIQEDQTVFKELSFLFQF